MSRLSTLIVSCLLLGCAAEGEKAVIVKGQVVENGQPIAISGYEEGIKGLRVIFVPLNQAGEPTTDLAHSANAHEDGSFQVPGTLGNGIPPGKYRVAVQQLDTVGGTAGSDVWKGKYGPTKSPFVYDIGDKGEILTIDLAKRPSGS